MKRLIAAVLGAAFLLAGCNTMEGVGQDIKAGSKKIEGEAQEAKRY